MKEISIKTYIYRKSIKLQRQEYQTQTGLHISHADYSRTMSVEE